jgi:hypothetical protein
VERLCLYNADDDPGGKEKQRHSSTSTEKADHYWDDSFRISDARASAIFTYSWMDKEKCLLNGMTLAGAEVVDATKTIKTVQAQEMCVIKKQLESHGIDCAKFGQGKFKTLAQLVKEVEDGSSLLMLDATVHKKLVRVVEMVCLRIRAHADDSGGEDVYLIETGEKFSDDRVRNIQRLPGAKKQPHENTLQVADKIMADFLGNLSGCDVEFDRSNIESFEEEWESPSYPGVYTVYRKEIVEGRITTADKSLRKECQPNAEFSQKGTVSDTSKSFKWMQRKACDAAGIRLQTPKDWTYSALVHAPIGMNQEDLSSFLETNKVDVSQFGKGPARTLQDFSNELLKGEAALVVDPDDGKVLRVVEPVLVELVNGQNDKVLVQTQQKHADGTEKPLSRLPGAKRRLDENMFSTAKKVIDRDLKIKGSLVTFDATDVQFTESIEDSPNFPGLRTLYRKTIVKARLEKV